MSKTMVMGPIVAALVKSEDILGGHRNWKTIKNEQGLFLKDFFSKRHELARFSGKELRSWVGRDADELNKVLEKEGFNIRLSDFEETEFGVVSILDVLVEWLQKGAKSSFFSKGRKYSSVRLESDFRGRMSLQYNMPIAVIETKSGDQVFMTIADRPYEGFELISRIEEISNAFMQHGTPYDSLEFPMVDLNHQVDISWLEKMWTFDKKNDTAEIARALQQTKFKMDETGARVKSAAAVVMRYTASIHEPRPLIINKPFFLWIRRPGMSMPIMYAYIDEADWKNPGSLEM